MRTDEFSSACIFDIFIHTVSFSDWPGNVSNFGLLIRKLNRINFYKFPILKETKFVIGNQS